MAQPAVGTAQTPSHYAAHGAVFDLGAFWGGVFDAVADNTTPLNDAIIACNAAGGGEVLLPDGTGLVGKINPKSGVKLRGRGVGRSTLKLKNSTNTDLVSCVNIDDFSIEDLTLDGNKANNSTGLQCLYLDNGVRFSIRNVRSINAKMDGLYVGYPTNGPSSDGIIENFTTSGCARNGLSITSGKRITVINPVVEDAGLMGIDLEPNSSADAMEEITLINPTVLTSVEANLAVTCQASGIARAITIINPTLLDTTHASANNFGLYIQSAPVVVRGGYITGANAQGVYINNNSSGASGVSGTILDGVTIVGNAATGIEFGSASVAFPRVTLIANTIRGNGNDGIYAAGALRCKIIGNDVSNNGTFGIRLASTGSAHALRNIVMGNDVYDDGTNTQTNAIVESGSANYNTIVGNGAKGTGANVTVVGANTINEHNQSA